MVFFSGFGNVNGDITAGSRVILAVLTVVADDSGGAGRALVSEEEPDEPLPKAVLKEMLFPSVAATIVPRRSVR